MQNKRKNGYTLLEVLAVVVILMVMSYFSVPLYNKVIQKADVAEAMKNIEMFSGAQEKYFLQNRRYASSLEDLETPLKKDGQNVSTSNFTYYLGNPVEDNYCIYSESKNKDYVLARNYKDNSEILCSGTDCGKVESLVKSGSLTTLCGGTYNSNCDVTCQSPKVLNSNKCVCECSTQCGQNQILNQETCICSCSPVAIENCSGANKEFNYENCSCSCQDQLSCGEGEVFNQSTCVCEEVAPSPSLNEDICKGQGKVYNSVHDQCVCSNEAISNCSGENQELDSSDCSCSCKKSLFCSSGQTFNPTLCICQEDDTECDISEEQCTNQGKFFVDCACVCDPNVDRTCTNGHFDNNTCSCACDLTDDMCDGRGYIVSDSACECVQSSCPEAVMCYNNNGNGHYDYRACQCVCDLTNDFCKEKFGKYLNETLCECVTPVHE